MGTKLFITLTAVVLLFLSGVAVRADFEHPPESQKPTLVSPLEIAMIYYKYSGKTPDFSAWALLSDEYKNASIYDKAAILDARSREIADSFGLLGPDEQIVADYPVTLSEYSLGNKGYLIESFKDDTFFPFSYGGENFALVPKNILDHQWIPAEGLPAKNIDDLRLASENGKDAVMTFFLVPKFADKVPVTIDGKEYHVIGVEVAGLAFFDSKEMFAWRQEKSTPLSPEFRQRQKELMTLYH
jgi:hypothetical protein